MMRISTAWAQQLGVNAMNAQQVKLSNTQMQLSSGLKILSPSDAPAAAVKILDLQESIDKTKQYQDNIEVTRSRLEIEESSLATAEDILIRAKELTVQALNSTLTADDRLSIKYEIDQMLEQMVGVSNTKNANGEYIFSGDFSTTPAVAWDPKTESYAYQGGINQRTLDVAPERRVADGDLGSDVFTNVDSVSQQANTTVDGAERNQRSVFDTLQSLSNALGQKYEVPEASITGDRFMAFGANYSGASTTSFNLTAENGTAVPVTLNANYASLDAVVTAINATPALATNNIEARSNGNQIEFVSTTTGKASSIKIDENTGSFLTDFGFNTGTTGSGADLGGTLAGNKVSAFLNYAASPASFELNDEQGNKQSISLGSNYADHAAMIADIQGQIVGSPIDGKIEINSSANPVEFRSVSSGGNVSVQIKQLSGDFLENTGFSSGDAGRIFNTTANDVLSDLDSALNNFLRVRTSVGARMHALDGQESQNEKFVLDMKSTLSDVQDLDYAEAISRFNIENTALQAAQQAYSRVQKLSLFNYL
jgi:flagellar hook-associated protein 3 FlgL